ncbi:MAG TPA: SDR family NAD(P)-dependent oxidoreductase [Gammaproteobacteria bacterium]
MADTRTSKAALVIGASRGIGLSVTEALLDDSRYATVFAACRSAETAGALKQLDAANQKLELLRLDVCDEASVREAAKTVEAETGRLDLLFYCAGILHDGDSMQPEKRLADVSAESLVAAFRVNALGALLVAREFESLLKAGSNPVFAALSARVGSIGDNRKGGWYAYRSSKAALNMMIKTLAIEWGRLPRPINCYALHPGTVATSLSEPFRGNMPPEKIFPPDRAARQLLETINGLGTPDSGGLFAYDGTAIEW